MTNAFVNGDRVEIRGLCSFFIKESYLDKINPVEFFGKYM